MPIPPTRPIHFMAWPPPSPPSIPLPPPCSVSDSPDHPACEKLPAIGLPDYIVAGEQKTGTSSLYNLLLEHPAVLRPPKGVNGKVPLALRDFKEPHYWSFKVRHEVSNGCLIEGEYERIRMFAISADDPRISANKRPGGNPFGLVPLTPDNGYTRLYTQLRIGASNGTGSDSTRQLAGDSSATMLTCACCPGAVVYHAPRTRVVVIIRHPIRRAVSQIVEVQSHLAYRKATLNRSLRAFKPAMSLDEHMTKINGDMRVQMLQNLPKLQTCINNSSTLARKVTCCRGQRTLGHSLYGITVRHWKGHFPDLLVVRSEDLATDPAAFLHRVGEHIGLPPHAWKASSIHRRYNPSACVRMAKQMDQHDTCTGPDGSGSRNDSYLDVPAEVEKRRPPWWRVLHSFYMRPGHQVPGFEYLGPYAVRPPSPPAPRVEVMPYPPPPPSRPPRRAGNPRAATADLERIEI